MGADLHNSNNNNNNNNGNGTSDKISLKNSSVVTLSFAARLKQAVVKKGTVCAQIFTTTAAAVAAAAATTKLRQ